MSPTTTNSQASDTTWARDVGASIGASDCRLELFGKQLLAAIAQRKCAKVVKKNGAIVGELVKLCKAVYRALNQRQVANYTIAADIYRDLSEDTRAILDSSNSLREPMPTEADIRIGDIGALHLLFGLNPVRPAIWEPPHDGRRKARPRLARDGAYWL
jgi:hypothetical protein